MKIELIKFNDLTTDVKIKLENEKRILKGYIIKSNFYKFKYKNVTKYFWIELGLKPDIIYFDYIEEKTYKTIYHIKDNMYQLVEMYKKYETEDLKIPSAPNSTTFSSIKRGDILFEEQYNHYGGQYGINRNYYYVIKIGSNIYYKLPKDFYDKLYTIYFNIVKSGFTLYGKTPILDRVFGSSYVVVGFR